jgi:rubrerythrin
MPDVEAALAVIRRAIHSEVTGQRFYSDAAYYCIDTWAKEIFATLAQEEEVHTRLLLLQHEALSTGGRWLDPEQALASDAEVDITRMNLTGDEAGAEEELFPPQWSASDTVDRRADDLAALAFGIQMEKRAVALYGEQASAARDPAARKAYEFLVLEEEQHYQQLKERWEELAGIPFAED